MLWGVGLFLKYPFSLSLLLFSTEVSFIWSNIICKYCFFLTRQQLPILMIVGREDNYKRKKKKTELWENVRHLATHLLREKCNECISNSKNVENSCWSIVSENSASPLNTNKQSPKWRVKKNKQQDGTGNYVYREKKHLKRWKHNKFHRKETRYILIIKYVFLSDSESHTWWIRRCVANVEWN